MKLAGRADSTGPYPSPKDASPVEANAGPPDDGPCFASPPNRAYDTPFMRDAAHRKITAITALFLRKYACFGRVLIP